MSDEWWKLSDEWWVMKTEWWVIIFLNQTRPKCCNHYLIRWNYLKYISWFFRLKRKSFYVNFYILVWLYFGCIYQNLFTVIKFFPTGLWSRASVYVMEFMEVNKIGSTISRAPDRKWSPPPSDLVFNLNLAFSQSWSKSSVGVGFLIRRSEERRVGKEC